MKLRAVGRSLVGGHWDVQESAANGVDTFAGGVTGSDVCEIQQFRPIYVKVLETV